MAKSGHNVTIYAISGRYDYCEFEKYNKIKVRDLGKFYFGNIDSDGIAHRSFLDKVLTRLLYNVIDYPRIEYFLKLLKH